MMFRRLSHNHFIFVHFICGPYSISILSENHGWAGAAPGLQYSPLGCAAYCVHHFSGWSDTALRLNSATKWQEAHVRTGFRQVTVISRFDVFIAQFQMSANETFVLHVLCAVRFSSGAEFYEKMENTFLNRQVQFFTLCFYFLDEST